MRFARHLKIYFTFALIILLGVAVQVWAALQGSANFNADEAIWGLMARHILFQRQMPTYFYGQRYLGTLEALFAALFLRWMGPDRIIALRILPIFLFGGFLTLYGILVSRVWGKQVALFSLVVLAFPGLILFWTFNSVCAYGTVLTLGTTALLLFYAPAAQKRWLDYAGWLIFGFIVGLGLWIHPMTIVYFVAIALVYWLQTPEWSVLYGKLGTFCDRVVGISLRELAPMLSLGLLGLGIMAFFTAGCEPYTLYVKAQSIARFILLFIGSGAVLMAFGVSVERKHWFLRIVALGIGGVVGNLPQWRAWLFYGVAPDSAVIPACPTGILSRLQLVMGQLVPAMWGILPLWNIAGDSFWYTGLRILILVVMLIAFVVFIWTERLALWSLISLTPLSRKTGRAVMWGVLFGLPILLVLLGGNIYDKFHVRYLIISWQINAVILALFLSRVVKRSKVLGLCLIGLWIVQVGVGNLMRIGQYWQAKRELWSPKVVAELEDFLRQHHVTGGYAEYWIAYPLDFLSEERLIFAPYNRIDRYPQYTQEVAKLSIRALILPVGVVPESSDLDDLVQSLTVGIWGAPAFPEILDRMRTQTVVQRRTIARWDVWVLADF